MRTMKFRSSHSQDANLYKLFCDGIADRAAAHSTVVFTSTPVEEEDDDLTGIEPLTDDLNTSSRSKRRDEVEKINKNVSTEVLIGSAESPYAPIAKHAVSQKKADETNGSKTLNKNPGKSVNDPKPSCILGSESKSKDVESNRTDKCSSPVDFVDRAIAIIRREKAAVSNPENPQHVDQSPAISSVRKQTQSHQKKSFTGSQDSSETDFEDVGTVGEKTTKENQCYSSTNSNNLPQSPSKLLALNNSQKKSTANENTSSPISRAVQPHPSKSLDGQNLQPVANESSSNPSAMCVSNKPRSSASSDGIRLRLSMSDVEDDSDKILSSQNLPSASDTDDDQNCDAARCRSFVELVNLNQRISNLSHVPIRSNQENNVVKEKSQDKSPSQKSDEHKATTSKQQDLLGHPNGNSNRVIHSSRSALTAISHIPSKPVEKNIFLGELSCTSLSSKVPDNKEQEQSSILKGVVAYVEVRSGHDNRSRGVGAQLCALGAEVVNKFCKQVTHVVFNEGPPGILKRAQDQGCNLVSVLWIEACKTKSHRVDESKYPPLNLHLYDSPNAVQKYRKVRSLQPDFDEDKCEERINKHLKRIKRKAQRDASHSQENNPDNVNSVPPSQSSCQEVDGVRVPRGVKLRRLSVVLNRLPQNSQTSALSSTISQKTKKRKLMPLEHFRSEDAGIDEFDPEDRTKLQCSFTSSATFTQKGAPPMSRILRLRQPKDSEVQKTNQNRSGCNAPCRPSYESRRSSVFIPKKPKRIRQVRSVTRPKVKNRRYIMPTMVCTFMHRREIDVVAAILKQLGGWILESTVSSKTTHVVCGDAKRTINLLRGIAQGCWVIHKEWIFRSVEAGRWLNEEPFELSEFPAARQCRIEREALGSHPNIFSSVGCVYVAENTSPPREALVELLHLCGAHVVNTPRQAQIIVGEHRLRKSTCCVASVKELWVLDSIQDNMLRSVRDYTID